MGYEEAPATRLVAKSCCVCGRPLVEAESIASGIGPICAKRTGFARPSLPPEVRAEVNRLVYECAALQLHADAIPRVARLRELGLELVADAISERLAGLARITLTLRGDGRLLLELPFIDDRAKFERLVAALRTVPGRRVEELPGSSDGVRRCTTIANARGPILALYRVLAEHLPGEPARSPKGLFVVPTVAELERVLAAPRAGRRPVDLAAEQQVLRLEERHA